MAAQPKAEINIPPAKPYVIIEQNKLKERFDVSPKNNKFSADEIAKMSTSDAVYVMDLGYRGHHESTYTRKPTGAHYAEAKKKEAADKSYEGLSSAVEAHRVFLQLPDAKIAAMFMSQANHNQTRLAEEYFPVIYRANKERAIKILLMLDDDKTAQDAGVRSYRTDAVTRVVSASMGSANRMLLSEKQLEGGNGQIDWSKRDGIQFRANHPQKIELDIKDALKAKDPAFAKKHIIEVRGG